MGFAPPGVKVPQIRLSAEGDWFVDGERVLHERTCSVLTKNVQLLDDGRFVTSIGRETAEIVVDDVGFFVCSADVDGSALRVALSDGSEHCLREPVLRAGPDGRLYVQVKDGRAWARFSRAAHQSLEALVDERDGRFGMHIGERFVSVS